MNDMFEVMQGQIVTSIKGLEQHSDDVRIFTADGSEFRMYHSQDCCETVAVEEVIGDLSDLIGEMIFEAEVVTSNDDPPSEWTDSHTWTFYKLGTRKGYVTIRWLGESNGYYGEEAAFEIVKAGRTTISMLKLRGHGGLVESMIDLRCVTDEVLNGA